MKKMLRLFCSCLVVVLMITTVSVPLSVSANSEMPIGTAFEASFVKTPEISKEMLAERKAICSEEMVARATITPDEASAAVSSNSTRDTDSPVIGFSHSTDENGEISSITCFLDMTLLETMTNSSSSQEVFDELVVEETEAL